MPFVSNVNVIGPVCVRGCFKSFLLHPFNFILFHLLSFRSRGLVVYTVYTAIMSCFLWPNVDRARQKLCRKEKCGNYYAEKRNLHRGTKTAANVSEFIVIPALILAIFLQHLFSPFLAEYRLLCCIYFRVLLQQHRMLYVCMPFPSRHLI